MRRDGNDCDVCVIGCGGTGAVAASVLANAGAKVIALEAGPVWDPASLLPDELEGYAFGNVLGPKWNADQVRWLDPATGRLAAGLGLNMMNGVGGSTLHYAAHAWRFHDDDFRARSGTVDRYGPGKIPPGSTIADWPLSYYDLEPYYHKVEEAIGVAGIAGVLAAEPPASPVSTGEGNPFEAPRAAGYPMPPLRPHRFGLRIADAAGKLGYHPFIGPTAINSVPYGGRPPTNYCGFCLGHACRVDAKGSPLVTMLPRAIWSGNLEIVSDAEVLQLELDDSERRVSRVVYWHEDGPRTCRATLFVLAAYVFETVRLLLLSPSAAFPRGLLNRSGQVGRHFMAHRFDGLGCVFDDHLNRFAGPQGQRMVIDDLNGDNFDHSELGFIRGGQIFAPNEFHPIQDLSLIPPGVPAWGAGYKRHVKQYWDKTAILLTNVETLPYHANYLELDVSHPDSRGRPLLRARAGSFANERRLVNFLLTKMGELALAAGASRAWPLRTMVIPSQHDAGGTRMGPDPSSSVVDRDGKGHDLDNLYLTGPSVFPTSSGLNPSLTAQALAWRTADAMLARL